MATQLNANRHWASDSLRENNSRLPSIFKYQKNLKSARFYLSNFNRQGSYRFLDPKFTTFSRLFLKQYTFFPDTRKTNRWSIETLKNAGTKLFHDALQTYGNHGATRTYKNYKSSHSVIKCLQYGRDWIRFDHGEKIHLWSTCYSFEKKKKLQACN